ncbi:MAG: histidine kinase [Bacteroidota bacterium]
MDTSGFWEKRFLGIRTRELVFLFLFYSFFGLAYNMAIYTTSGGRSNFVPNIFLDYGLKALYAIPVWWLMFRRLPTWSVWQKLSLHLVILPIYVILWQQTYYLLCDSLDIWHLGWPGAWWDIYIPGLFYGLQFGAFHIYDFYVELQKQRELEAKLREATLQAELTALKAQLNPHFLYNTFNTISASVPPGQEKTRELIATLSDMFRYVLRSSKEEVVPIKDELEFIRQYLAIEKARFESRLRYQLDVDPELENIAIPPMILQPIVENAVKHGIAPKIEGGHIEVIIQREGPEVQFIVSDTGKGLTDKWQESRGVGLKNTRLRLEKMYQRQLQLNDKESGGVRVEFRIPMDKKTA